MATPSIETVRGWRGRVMVDRDSNKIGEIVDIYLDNETGRPEWAVVRTGLFGLRSTFVPLADVREVGDELQVPHQRLQVKQAPNIEPDGQLSAAEEEGAQDGDPEHRNGPWVAGPGHGRPRQQQDRRGRRHLPGQRDRPA